LTDPIVIWGAGAIGGTLGAALARNGEDIIFVDTAADHVRAIQAKGLRIPGPILEDTIRAPAFEPAALQGKFQRVFLCVKALYTRTAAGSLRPHLARDGYVVSAQNGLNELVIADAVGQERTVDCFLNFGADYLEPDEDQYSGRGSLVVGETTGHHTERTVALHRLLQRFEPNARLTDNIWGYLWGKLIYGALLFATALTDDSIVDVLESRQFRDALTNLAREIGAVAQAEGIRPEAFDGFDPAAFLPGAPADALDRSFADMVAHNRRSTKTHSGGWRDLAIRKRRTECEPQLGPIVQAGQRRGIPTPLTERLIALIHDLETGNRSFSRNNIDLLMTPEMDNVK
jgi:2-dehydropantoate 2-reductase